MHSICPDAPKISKCNSQINMQSPVRRAGSVARLTADSELLEPIDCLLQRGCCRGMAKVNAVCNKFSSTGLSGVRPVDRCLCAELMAFVPTDFLGDAGMQQRSMRDS